MTTQSLQQLLRSTLALSQFSAVFPVRGVMDSSSLNLRFRWCSLLVVYWLVTWVGLTFGFYRSYTVTRFRNPDGTLSAVSNFSLLRWGVPPMVIYPLFLQFSHRWPQFVQTWEDIEGKLKLKCSTKVLSYKIFIYTLLFAALKFLFVTSGYMVAGVRIVQCKNLTSLSDFVNMLFQVRFPHIPATSPTFWKYIICYFLELISTWAWMCSELIVLHFSLILLTKLKAFNACLNQSHFKVSPHFWYVMRKEYVKLAILTHMADSLLSPFIFSLVISETMLVILFIYLVLTNSFSILSYGYFIIFFLSHLSLDVVTLVAMASIFDESKKPLIVLHNLPSAFFSKEVRRLYSHVKRDTVALTGCKFFVVTQSAILSIISALVTYEVLLVQLGNLIHDNKPSAIKEDFCAWIEQYLNLKD